MKLRLSTSAGRAAAALAVSTALAGCAMPNQGDTGATAPATPTTMTPRPANTPAMSPDRVRDDRPRSFSDPGPMYPDTGR